MAYNEPIRFQYRGDKVVALRYVREARRLLYLYLEELTKSGARAGRRRMNLQGGIVIELIVAFNNITAIITTPEAKDTEVRSFNDFVTIARTESFPDGIDADYPQQILRAPIKKEGWRTFFFNAGITGYEDFDGPKGTYHLNPDGTELFPDGLVSAGNIDWLGPNGERISWYGPDTRYWYDTFRQGRAQYGRFVFCLGEVLLDVDQYCLDTDDDWDARLVLGAGLRDTEDGKKWLYVVTADIPDVVTPVVDVPPNSAYWSTNFPTDDITVQMRAIRLVEDIGASKAQRWAPDPTEYVYLLQTVIPAGINPWVFNRDCTKAVSFVHSLHTQVLFSDLYSQTLFSGTAPIEDSYRVDVTLTDPFLPEIDFTTINTPPLGRCQCAADFNAANEEISIDISREPHGGSPSAVVMYFGQMRVPMWFVDNSAPGYTHGCTRRSVVWADAREGVVVSSTQFNAWTEVAPRNALAQLSTEIIRGGTVVARLGLTQELLTDLPTQPRNRDIGALQAMAGVTVAPFVFMWMLSMQVAFGGTRVQNLGLSAANATAPHDSVDCFGQYRATGSGSTPTPSIPFPTVSQFFNNKADIHGHKVAASGAVKDDTILYSGFAIASRVGYGGAHDQSVSFVTGNNFPNLTGVSGTYQRYHPVWVLGLPIGGENP